MLNLQTINTFIGLIVCKNPRQLVKIEMKLNRKMVQTSISCKVYTEILKLNLIPFKKITYLFISEQTQAAK
jgi:hypothetical protein